MMRAPSAAGNSGSPRNPHITMKRLTSSEIRKWLAGQGMHHQPLDCGVPIAGDFILPADPRARLQLSDHIADLLGKDGNQLVEILPAYQTLIHESELLDHFRASLGDEQPQCSSSPGHLFKSRDRHEFRSLLGLLLGFQNSLPFYIYSAPSHTTLFISGPRLEIWSAKKGPRNELGRLLAPPQAA
jgi:hypothetical protein